MMNKGFYFIFCTYNFSHVGKCHKKQKPPSEAFRLATLLKRDSNTGMCL